MRKRIYLSVLLVLIVAAAGIFIGKYRNAKEMRAARWSFFFEEYRIQALLQKLSREYKPARFAITDVDVLTMKEEAVLRHRTVLVEDSRILAVGDAESTPVPEGFTEIRGTVMILMPGLVDMHVHNLVSSSQHLLNLANGVTTVRDMDGFSWLLKQREQAKNNRLLAPNLYVAGQILNASPMDWYAMVIKTAEEGREAVRQQKKDGYDFIKVHNNMPLEIYSAILDEAAKQKIDVVGHIPHQVSLSQAVQKGQHTLEHFKGYILDSTLTLTNENYVEITKNSEAWNCPTLYAYREHVRGEEAKKLLASKEMRYASWRDREDWLALSNEAPDARQQNILPMSKKIMHDLIPVTDRFIAGTDSGGGYPFMVPGFSLLVELRMLNESGLTPYQTLQAATIHAAQAMGRESEFGTIEPGKRADLVLLKENPLEDLSTLNSPEGVAVRGIWLGRKDLDSILREIETIYNPDPKLQNLNPPDREAIRQLVTNMQALAAEGFVFRGHDLDELGELLEHEGIPEPAW